MNLFRNLKITHQFLILFGVLIIGFAAIGLLYKQVLDAEQASGSQLQRTNLFGDLVTRAAGDLSALNADQANFQRTNDLQYADNFGVLAGESQQKINALEQNIPGEKALGLVSQMREGLAAYEDTFDALIDTKVLLGLDENQGLHGELRAAVHAVEERVRGLDNPELVASMLQMRRHEKDFIQREDRKYVRMMAEEQAVFAELLSKTSIPAKEKKAIADEMSTYAKALSAFVDGTEQLEARADDLQTAFYVLDPLVASLLEQRDEAAAAILKNVAAVRSQSTFRFILAMGAVGLIIAIVLWFVALRMRRSIGKLQNTMQKVANGDFSARNKLATGDELGALGTSFDNLLDERVSTLSKVEQENEALNDSIIALMISVSQLSQKDLTVKATVAEDVTGPVSDAVNLMTSETTTVLARIREVSQQVEHAATTVRAQAEKVNAVAAGERELLQASADELRQAGETMAELAKGAEGANKTAGVAMDHTRNARQAVSTTVGGIEQIREIIRETEKRIKRLGERSQEITGAVNLINTIAERTHILALNASMHAASAGEAGRGFAVVADEVQRLAQSSREATSDISSMVNAIRVETADTVDTMNQVIAQVAEGTRQAQEAGERMQETESTTAELVSAVGEIATAAERQARIALELMQRSQAILESTEQTSRELEEQSAQTVNLVDYSQALRSSVGVFKLPDAA